MTKEEFINQLPEMDDYLRIYEYMLPQEGGMIYFGGDNYLYEEVNIDDFYNE